MSEPELNKWHNYSILWYSVCYTHIKLYIIPAIVLKSNSDTNFFSDGVREINEWKNDKIKVLKFWNFKRLNKYKAWHTSHHWGVLRSSDKI